MRVLCVAEKPSIAKALARALGGGSCKTNRTDNKFIYNYEVAYNSPVWGSCEFTVTSVAGHLTDIKFLPPFDKWDSEAVQLFSAPITSFVTPEGEKIARNIEKLSRLASRLFIWTDCDREGEHIGGEVAEVALRANRKIEVFRAQFSNTESSHLVAAAGQPRALDRNQVAAVDVRRELDLRTGYSMTRLQTQMYRAAFGSLFANRAVQYGSCQFPTLGFVVDRYLKIKNHISEAFWTIDAGAKDANETVPVKWQRGNVFDHLTTLAFYERALEKGDKFIVKSIHRKDANRLKPLPLTTVMLQKKGATSLKMSSKKIMDLAEKLYNDGYVSYPRTETDSFDANIDVRELAKKHCQGPDTPWKAYTQALLASQGGYEAPRKGKNNDKAHPPIHPVTVAAQSSFQNQDLWRVYEFIVRSFLACCSQDAKGFNTTIKLEYGEEIFTASGDQITQRGFLDVYPYQKWTGKKLPEWAIGQKLDCTSFVLKERKTTPPSPLTESELVGLMDANGIGTDATMADHIQKIQDREYVVKKGSHFEPTALGIALVLSYDSIGLNLSLTKPFLRKETEELVSAIAKGEKTKGAVLGQLVAQYENVFKQANARRGDLMREAGKHLRPIAAN